MSFIYELLHADYSDDCYEWEKWRLAYKGGRKFVTKYLQKLSSRELNEDFTTRSAMTYVPKYAAAAINEIKNSIYQRMIDVTRTGGADSFTSAVLGEIGGVDLCGTKMNTFMGSKVLLELLIMGKVGVLVDSPSDLGMTIKDKGRLHPFVTMYTRENILNWRYQILNGVRRLTSLLLSEKYDEETEYGLSSDCKKRYRLLQRLDGAVKVSFFMEEEEEPYEVHTLAIPEIPFHVFEIEYSLMQDVADYQIALMNLESSDISLAMKSNYPIYYEFFDPRYEQEFAKTPHSGDGTAAEQNKSRTKEIAIGGTQGRRISKDLDAPGFINPSPETLTVSMKKGDAIKDDIYRLVNLNLENSARSAESKRESQRTLESSLSFLGTLLEDGELAIAEHWSQFEGSTSKTVIAYPGSYDLKSQAQRIEEAEKCGKLMKDIPSQTYKKELAKRIVRTMIGNDSTSDTIRKADAEIDSAMTMTTDPDTLVAMHEAGLVAGEEASVAAGFSKGSFEKAKAEHLERVKAIADAQGAADPARGVKDMGTSKGEKVGKPQRGNGKVGGGSK